MKTIRAAQNLKMRGCKSKQVIGIMAANSDYLTPIVYAAFCLGCPISALSSCVDKSDVVRMFGMTEPTVVFCDVEVHDLVKQSLDELKNAAKFFTFNGTKGGSEPVENLFAKTKMEERFM